MTGRSGCGAGPHALVAQQRVQARLAATEGFERLHSRAAAAFFQNGLAVAASGLGVGLSAGQGGFFKGGVGVGAQHLGPFVAVVTGGVATGKNMAEAVRCAVPGRGLEHGNLRAHFAQHAHEVSPCSRFAVQAHVKQRELDLAQGLQPALEVFGGQHLVEQGARQGLAGVHMRGHVAQHAPFPAKVFHELAG